MNPTIIVFWKRRQSGPSSVHFVSPTAEPSHYHFLEKKKNVVVMRHDLQSLATFCYGMGT
jgi:hypothetical protein